MKVLVTGGTGLIGIHAIDEMLRQGKQVRTLVRSREKLQTCLKPFDRSIDELEVAIGDINDKASIMAATQECDALLHCAGIFSSRQSDAKLLWVTNVDGTNNVLHCGAKAGLDPIIHVSSYLALFPAPGNMHTADDPVRQPKSLYSKTKAAAERIARKLQDSGLPIVTVYPGSVQGPHDPTYSIGSQLIEGNLKTRKLLITDGGRAFTDARDLAQLLDRALQPGRGPKRYMAGGYYLSYVELQKILTSITGYTFKQQRLPGWLLRGMGASSDILSRLTGKVFQLTGEAAEVLTRSLPTDDQPAIDEFKLTRIGVEKSFHDLISWMVQTGKLTDPALVSMINERQH